MNADFFPSTTVQDYILSAEITSNQVYDEINVYTQLIYKIGEEVVKYTINGRLAEEFEDFCSFINDCINL